MASVQEESPVSEENLTAATVGKTDVDPTMELTTMMGKLMKRMETLERQQTRSSAATTQGVMPERDATNRFTTRRRRAVCWNCQQPGHIARFCRQGVPQSSEGSSKARNVTTVSPISPTDSYRLQVVLGGIKISLLLDTGAAVTLIRKDTWDQITSSSHSPPLLMPCPALELVNADGSPLETHGKASLLLELEGNSLPIDVIVVNSLTSEGILGLDFLKKQRASINFDTEVLHLPNHKCVIPLLGSTAVKNIAHFKVRAVNNVKVAAYSELEIMAHLERPAEEDTWILENTICNPVCVVAARALINPKSSEVPVRLINFSSEPAIIYAGKEIATIERVGKDTALTERSKLTPYNDITYEKLVMIHEMVEESESGLSIEQKELFYQLLLAYADVIAGSSSDLGRTHKLQHSINTGNSTPIRQPVRRLSPQQRSEVQKLLNQILENGVVEPSASPWASPIVLVKKKDGSTRFCVDYRKVNEVTRKDAYPLPRIDTTLDTLAGSQWFSTIDLVSGYWQVEIEQEDRLKTAFCTTEGLFQFRVMPFGLCNAPATFQRLMDLVLSGLQWSQCLVYLDDVIVLGRTFEDHLDNLHQVLQRLREAGLKLKPSKCAFFREKVEYLGHTISRQGVTPDSSKTEKIATWPISPHL